MNMKYKPVFNAVEMGVFGAACPMLPERGADSCVQKLVDNMVSLVSWRECGSVSTFVLGAIIADGFRHHGSWR
jgi:hypothetical protein